MDDKKDLIIIANPVSGVRHLSPEKLRRSIAHSLDSSLFQYTLHMTIKPGHAREIALDGLERGVQMFLVAGGDGTVNEVASVLKMTDAIMGIIPSGSGNGLAHHLEIPSSIEEALQVFNRQKVQRIDTCTVNERFFVSIAGIGFDARVAGQFAKNNRRGFLTYIKIVFKEYISYKPQKYRLTFNDQIIKSRAFFISFANSSQFGYNTRIAPGASLTDGLIDMCVVRKPPLRAFPVVAHHLLRRKADRSKYLRIYQTASVGVSRKKGKTVNIDGEPVKMGKDLIVKVIPSSLNLVIP